MQKRKKKKLRHVIVIHANIPRIATFTDEALSFTLSTYVRPFQVHEVITLPSPRHFASVSMDPFVVVMPTS